MNTPERPARLAAAAAFVLLALGLPTTAWAQRDCTELRIDKQVSCDGGLTWTDVGDVEMNEDGSNGCLGWNAHPGMPAEGLFARYLIRNIGSVGVMGCILHETNTAILPESMALGNLAAGQSLLVEQLDQVCTEALDDAEPDTAAVQCFCPSEGNPFDNPVSAVDSADFDCQTPGLGVHKVCKPAQDSSSQVFIRVTNTGDADLENCLITEEVFLDDSSCPADYGLATPVTPSVAVIPDLAAGSPPVEITATVAGLGKDACNQVRVTCEICDVDKTITVVADDVCEVGEGCLTRTPGFWGTHPEVTAGFLPLTVCGVEMTTTEAGLAASITEDLCSNGRDVKAAATSPPQLQLLRQCAAAALNLTAGASAGGSCEASFPGTNMLFEQCCGGADPVCSSGATAQEIAASGCIEKLDAFNNSTDTMAAFGPFVSPGPATPEECRDANGNGVVNTGRSLGPAAPSSAAKKAARVRGHLGKRGR
jgi:hypothetical protein